MAWGDQGINHYIYGAGTWSQYYWNTSQNPNATFENCMANCTTYAYGRVKENGLPAPVTVIRNANLWHTVVNTSAGWDVLNYYDGMYLYPGDILQWGDREKYLAGESPQYRYSAVHVAVVETRGTSPSISGSWYTGDDGTADSDRTTAVMGNTLASVSNWMVSHYSNRFYHSTTIASESNRAGHGYAPLYVLRHTGGGGGESPSVSVSPSSASATISGADNYVDFNFTVTVSGIPENEDASDGISFSENCYRYAYTSGWEYTDYVVGGVTYRRGVRSLIVRYERQHEYAYTDTAYMYYIKAFTNGTVNHSTPMNITIEEGGSTDDLMLIISAYVNGKKKNKINVKIV